MSLRDEDGRLHVKSYNRAESGKHMRQPRDLRKPSGIRLAAAGAASLIGAAYCAASGLGGLDEICLTSGCALYKNVRLAGLSLWWWGALAFLFLGGASFIGKAGLAMWAAVLFVGADLFFLGWLALTTPCISCLGAAFFFALVLFLLRPSQGAGAKISLIALLAWLFLLSPNLFMSLKEIQGPWPVHGRSDSPVSVYFSPSCPVCLDTIYAMAEKKIDAAFYPVGEAPGDEDRLRAMMQRPVSYTHLRAHET